MKDFYCLTHRHPEVHSCIVLIQQTKRLCEETRRAADAKAEEIEKKNKLIAQLDIKKSSGVKSTNKKTLSKAGTIRAAKIKVMKLKGKAKGANHIPVNNRLYFEIVYQAKTYELFADSSFSIGRLKEYFISTFKLKGNFHNYHSTYKCIILYAE